MLAKEVSPTAGTNLILNSVGALRNITLHEPARQATLDTGIVPVLIGLLENGDRGIRTAVAGLLQNITINAHAKVCYSFGLATFSDD